MPGSRYHPGGWVLGPTAIEGGRAKRQSATDEQGKKVLARDPFEVLVHAVDLLDAKERTAMHHALHQVLTTLAASGAHRRFGVLHVPQWRDAPQPNKRELLGP